MKRIRLAAMQPRTARALAVTGVVATAALTGTAWSLAYLNHDINVITSAFGPDLVTPFGIGLVGLIIALRQRHNPLGWLFLAGALIGALHAASGEYAIRGLTLASGLPGTDWVAWVSNFIISVLFPGGLLVFILLLFPTGRVPSRRWRILTYVSVVYTVLLLFFTTAPDYPMMIAPNVRRVMPPVSIKGFSSTFLANFWVIWPLGILLLLAATVSLMARYRRSAGEERQQIKWFAYAVAITVVAYAASIPFQLSSSYNAPLSNVIIEAGFGVALPVACGIAILRYRLYGIDLVISRTLVYGALAVLITGVYVGIAVGIGEFVGSGGRPNLGLSILATAIVAMGFQPARAWLQRVANRLVYGRRATPYQVLSEFSSHVAGSYAARRGAAAHGPRAAGGDGRAVRDGLAAKWR